MSKINQNRVKKTKLITLPKTQLSDGEEISWGDLTVPPTLTENSNIKYEKPQKKTTLSNPSDKLEENLDKNMIKN